MARCSWRSTRPRASTRRSSARFHATVERAIDADETRLIEDAIAVGRVRPVSPPDMARALALHNGNYLLDTLGRRPREDPAVVLETLWTVWTGALGFRGVVTWGPDRV